MLFNSYLFLFAFLPLTLIAFSLGSLGGPALAIGLLLAASWAFYAYWSVAYLPVLLASIIGNYLLARLIDLAGPRTRAALWLLTAALALNLAALGYFKYTNFVRSVAGLSPVDIILPLGISFFTFHQVAYLVEVYRTGGSERSFLRYGLFVSFFPQLIAGPILFAREMLPQFRPMPLGLRADNLVVGVTIFTIGLTKKVLLADNFAALATPVFAAASAGEAVTASQAWSAALCYSLQIYFDFSGYSDMAIGLARMFGITLPLNFFSPYKATSIIEFWRRWHITLSWFLRNYLYIPLGGRQRRTVALLLTMTLGGLWHGAGWTFIVWGLLHGAFIVINHAWRVAGLPFPAMLGGPLTFLCVLVAWVFFRADSMGAALTLLAAMFDLRNPGLAWPGYWVAALLSAGCLIVWLAPNTQQIMSSHHRMIDYYGHNGTCRWRWQPTLPWVALTAAIFAASVLSLNRPTEFIYFQF